MVFPLILILMTSTAVSSRMIDRQTDLLWTNDEDFKHEIAHIYWPRVQKRSLNGTSLVSFSAFRQKIYLSLHPIANELLVGYETPVFRVYEVENEPVFKKMGRNIVELASIASIYEDRKKRASLSVTYDAKRRQKSITGFIESYNLIIQPVSDGTNCSIDKIPVGEVKDYHCHLISQGKLPETHHKDVKRETRELDNNSSTLPAEVYPEILIIIDYSLYRLFNRRPRKIIPYLLSYWNAIDWKYRSFTSPKIRLNIAGIFLARSENALSYTKHLQENVEQRHRTTMKEMGKWLNKYRDEIPFNFDLGVTMTATQLEIHNEVDGIAYQNGMCLELWKIALINDLGGYNSILQMTHELAHTMGADHDDEYTECNGTISSHMMDGVSSLTSNASRWSDCSVKAIQEFLRNESTSHCLHNKPNPGTLVLTYLPGKMMTAEQQCINTAGGGLREMDESICQELRCFNSNGRYYRRLPGAADGTKCAEKKICYDSKCVFEK